MLNSNPFPEPDLLEKLLEATGKNLDFSFFVSRQLQANATNCLRLFYLDVL
jgi:hypothetical protein